MAIAILSCCSITSICQSNINPSTSVPDSKLRDAALLIEKGKIDAEKVTLLSKKIDSLNECINILQGVIKQHSEKDTTQARVTATYQAEIKNLTEERDIVAKEMKRQNKFYRRQKRKTVFAAISSAAVTAAVFVFIIKQ